MKTFYNQGEKCDVERGSCLDNQIYDLLKKDKEDIAKGHKPNYIADSNFERLVSSSNSTSLIANFNMGHSSIIKLD